jgi:pSer/pThr/pTyr-binding forkhead associated (FHA) protein
MGTTFEEKTEVRPPQTGLLSQTGLLNGDAHSTFVLNKNRSLRAMLGKETKPIDESAPGKEVQLIIRGIPEKVTLRESGSLILGRAELKAKGFQPDLDLSPYGAVVKGVSRVHARLFMDKGELYVADLYSTNGTYVSGSRIESNAPERLFNGDEVLLGALLIQVKFD